MTIIFVEPALRNYFYADMVNNLELYVHVTRHDQIHSTAHILTQNLRLTASHSPQFSVSSSVPELYRGNWLAKQILREHCETGCVRAPHAFPWPEVNPNHDYHGRLPAEQSVAIHMQSNQTHTYTPKQRMPATNVNGFVCSWPHAFTTLMCS